MLRRAEDGRGRGYVGGLELRLAPPVGRATLDCAHPALTIGFASCLEHQLIHRPRDLDPVPVACERSHAGHLLQWHRHRRVPRRFGDHRALGVLRMASMAVDRSREPRASGDGARRAVRIVEAALDIVAPNKARSDASRRGVPLVHEAAQSRVVGFFAHRHARRPLKGQEFRPRLGGPRLVTGETRATWHGRGRPRARGKWVDHRSVTVCDGRCSPTVVGSTHHRRRHFRPTPVVLWPPTSNTSRRRDTMSATRRSRPSARSRPARKSLSDRDRLACNQAPPSARRSRRHADAPDRCASSHRRPHPTDCALGKRSGKRCHRLCQHVHPQFRQRVRRWWSRLGVSTLSTWHRLPGLRRTNGLQPSSDAATLATLAAELTASGTAATL